MQCDITPYTLIIFFFDAFDAVYYNGYRFPLKAGIQFTTQPPYSFAACLASRRWYLHLIPWGAVIAIEIRPQRDLNPALSRTSQLDDSCQTCSLVTNKLTGLPPLELGVNDHH